MTPIADYRAILYNAPDARSSAGWNLRRSRNLPYVASKATAEVRVLEAPSHLGGSVWLLGVFCVKGPLRLGDNLAVGISPEGDSHPIRAEVVDIEFFGQALDSLDPVFSANVMLKGEIGRVGRDWTLLGQNA